MEDLQYPSLHPRFLFIANSSTVQTHPRLLETWYRTPFDFISRENFVFDRDLFFMITILLQLHLPLLSRRNPNPDSNTAAAKRPWDRIPCETIAPPDSALFILVLVIPFYAFSFCIAWNFHFPTNAERVLWRACSVWHGVYTTAAGIHYAVASWSFLQKTKNGESTSKAVNGLVRKMPPRSEADDIESQPTEGKRHQKPRRKLRKLLARLRAPRWLARWRNLSEDQDPDVESSLSGIVLWMAGGVLFCVCRGYLYAEDFISLRSQPAGVYETVNSYLPFIGS